MDATDSVLGILTQCEGRDHVSLRWEACIWSLQTRFGPRGLNERKQQGGTKMKYEKPVLEVLQTATQAILGGGKPTHIVTENRQATLMAYEADE
jgi:hypothetical protein